jgi:NADP-dependent 3-hydroxy acid dehydrogenase YdfG
MSTQLSGKVVIIVGASSGMGRATALAASKAGASVVVAARNADSLTQLAAQIRQMNGDVIALPTDATQRAEVDQMLAAALKSHGRIDVLVNSVGVNIPKRTIAELNAESWAMMMDTNLTSAFHITQAIVPVFRRQKEGLLIHISSSAARKPDRSGIAYQAGKAGVAALAHGTMEEERENGIRVSVIYPGMTDTPLVYKRPVLPTPEMLAKALQPEDVAAACLFVMSMPPRAHVPELVVYPSRL